MGTDGVLQLMRKGASAMNGPGDSVTIVPVDSASPQLVPRDTVSKLVSRGILELREGFYRISRSK